MTESDINSQLTKLSEEYSAYDIAKKRMEPTTTRTQTTTAMNLKMELELRELKRELQRMNKQYLDATTAKPPSGFHKLGLSTFEDWTLAAFFFTFALFGIVLTGYFASLSAVPWRVSIFGLVLTAMVLGVSFVLLRALG